jgi:hypothetical protein
MMRVAIIALLISLAALGLAGFATVRTFNESHPAPPVAESQWSEAECTDAKDAVFGGTLPSGTPYAGILERGCMHGGNCTAFNDMLQAIAENCP